METPASIERRLFELNRDARNALARGDAAEALRKLREALDLEPQSLSLRLNYAAALRRSGDLAAALAAAEDALRIDPRSFNALLLKGGLLEETGETVEAGRVYGLALMFKPPQALDAPTTAALARAQQVHERYLAMRTEAVDRSIEAVIAKLPGEPPASVRRFGDITAGRRRLFQPQPTAYHFPGLPSQEFYDRALFSWIGDLEARTADLLAELEAARTARGELFIPYVDEDDSVPLDQWRELNRSDRWSALHVIRSGRTCSYAPDLFPRTLDALTLMPQPDVLGRTPNAMFSALRPRTRIPPHTGVSNARLVLHLPLVVPPACGFRVGSETREWKVGEAWVFDDTIEHEAWNDSDEIRIILIADLWNVFMTEAERAAYAAVVVALDQHHGASPQHDL